jgi:hypothetical protein
MLQNPHPYCAEASLNEARSSSVPKQRRARFYNCAMSEVTLKELEAAINGWKQARPADAHTCALAPEVAALAKPYALLIWQQQPSIAHAQLSEPAQRALAAWHTALQHAA